MSETQSPIGKQARVRTRRIVAALLLFATLTLVSMAVVNFSQRAQFARVGDGVVWDVSPQGIVASLVYFGAPANRAGVRAGDILVSMNGKPIDSLADVIRALVRAQAGSEIQYELRRPGGGSETRSVSLTVVPIVEVDPFSLRGFLEFVGVLYLGIGLFVLIRRWTASHALHFYIFCLTSFVVYSFSFSGRLDAFDWAIFWADSGALLLQPAIFLHFALSFPEPRPWFRSNQWRFGLLYVPAAGLLLYHVLAFGTGQTSPSGDVWERIDPYEFAHMALLFLIAAAVFEYTYRTAKEPTLIQQMKWVTRGTWMAILPFTAFYVLPLFTDSPPANWMKLSTLSLIFIPLTFGYAIIRYRLMDVDLIFRRGVAYTLATALVAFVYFGITVAIAEMFHTNLSFGTGGIIVAIVIAAALFPPIKDWTELRLEKLFYRERFDYRRTMEEFARELANEIDLDRLMARMLDRMVATLPVQRLAVFISESGDDAGWFRLARGVGAFPRDVSLPLAPLIQATGAGYVYSDPQQPIHGLDTETQVRLNNLGLNYFIPCRVQDRTIGLIALSKTLEGSLLSSEDIELTQTIAHNLAVALENARLYKDLAQKAEQVSRLKDFSESILESSTVGLVALSNESRIESWNGTMERLTGIARDRALNAPLDAVFPDDLVEEIRIRSDDTKVSSLYKFELRHSDGRNILINVSVTPLRSKDNHPVGRLLVFDDITERVQMEQQLLQTEKLTSLGLLAAGVAHEVNTPLAVISNYAQMLAKQFPASDERGALVEKIVSQTFRASEIVSGLLNFSRTGPGTLETFNLNDALEETLELLKHQLREQGIAVELDLSQDLPFIHGDPGKVQQVLLNLLLNARDSMPSGGKISVRSRTRNARVVVEVSDTGGGIPREDLSRIFDPFFTTKATGRGTGLGLAVSYGIIKDHRGTILADSEPGRGTTFTLDFPAAASVPASQRSANG